MKLVLLSPLWMLACRAPDPTVQSIDPGTTDAQDTAEVDVPTDTSPPADTGEPVVTPPQIWLNEFMASNQGTAQSETGSYPDWIELFNPGPDPVDLDGWVLGSGEQESELRDLDLASGEMLLLWADGDAALGPNHLNLTLARGGGELWLARPEGDLADSLSYPEQATDISAARWTDGAPTWVLSADPTPGSANLALDPGDPDPLAPTEACEATSDLTEVYFLEGDLITLSVGCSGALPTEEAEILPIRVPEGATVTESALSWQTGPADGGRADLIWSVRPAGATDRVPAAATVTFWVADDPSNPDNIAVVPADYTEEWGLPVFHLQTDSALSQSYQAGDLTYRGHSYTMEAKIRGATSASFPKPSYTMKFSDEEIPVEDWPETRNHLVLLSTFDDNAYVRQKLVYDLWQEMAAHQGAQRLTPRTFFCVLYLDGEYTGLYVGLDHVDNEFVRQMGLDDSGDMYKAINHDANFALTNSSGVAKSSLADGYEKKEGEPTDDFSDLISLVDFTGSSNAEELVAGADSWLDLEEFMDWFLLVHYTLAEDSAGKNSYLYVDPADGRTRFAPWDFNHSWGQGWYTYRTGSGSLNYFTSTNRVFGAIQSVESANNALWARYADLADDGPLSLAWQLAQLDDYYALIEPSAERDWAKWEGEYRSYWWAAYRNDWTSYQEEKAYLYEWVEERSAVIAGLHP